MIQAYELAGEPDKAEKLKRKQRSVAETPGIADDDVQENANALPNALTLGLGLTKTNIDYLFNE